MRDIPVPIQDHPRIRGEHLAALAGDSGSGGSSPHTRGAPADLLDPARGRGIIPAYAGSTSASSSVACARRDHPRIRGEHSPARADKPHFPGSSPHTRGARGADVQVTRPARIIPAYAGSTVKLSYLWAPSHGSSPHTRGARLMIDDGIDSRGIIPAYAGSTTTSNAPPKAWTDHPRIRGEHLKTPPGESMRVGSSPHTRGALLKERVDDVPVRIIPAYAGSTAGSAAGRLARRDHPRIRGEHTRTSTTPRGHPGSSPHTRGARSSPRRSSASAGIIPAYAGSTSTP